MPEPSGNNDGDDEGDILERRKNARSDPFDALVHNHMDLIGLIAYGLFREKKNQLINDPNDRSRQYFFDSTAKEYSNELRMLAELWYKEVHETIEKQNFEKSLGKTQEFINSKLDGFIKKQERFPWLRSAFSSAFGTLIFAISLIVLSFLMNYLPHFDPLSVWEKVKEVPVNAP